MNWLKRLQNRVCFGSGHTARDIIHSVPMAREGLFPDLAPRHLGWDFIDKFDPFNLVVSTRLPRPFQEERNMVLRGELDEARTIIRRKKDSMNENQRLGYILEITNPVHELRHFHDFIGTQMGIRRFTKTVRDTADFVHLVFTLRERGPIKLPLMRWHDSGDGPDELREYVWRRREYVEWLRLYDGAHPATEDVPGLADFSVAIIYNVGKTQLIVPTVEIELSPAVNATRMRRLFILGAQALMEGTAIAIQRWLVSYLFGSEEQQLFVKAISRGDKANLTFVPYVLVSAYMGRRVGQHDMAYQLALSDLAMTFGRTQDGVGVHPGVYFLEAISNAEDLGTDWRNRPDDWSEFMNKVAEKCGWDTCQTRANQILQGIQEDEEAFQKSPQPHHWIDSLLNAVYASHKQFTEIRRERPRVLADPLEYLIIMPHLPKPFAEWDGKELQMFGRTMDEATVFREWYFWDHLQRQLLFSTKLPCANPKGHRECIGSLLNPKKGRDDLSCPFRQFVEGLGLLNVRCERA